MCPDCGKQKMLFETEKQAQNFLKFNEEAVNPDGTREMRVYYCPACCGYHISSHKYLGSGRATEKLIERYKRDKHTSYTEIFELYDLIVAQNFTSRKALNRWLKSLDKYSDATKDQARLKFYKDNPDVLKKKEE